MLDFLCESSAWQYQTLFSMKNKNILACCLCYNFVISNLIFTEKEKKNKKKKQQNKHFSIVRQLALTVKPLQVGGRQGLRNYINAMHKFKKILA